MKRLFARSICTLVVFLAAGCCSIEQSAKRDLRGVTIVGTDGSPEEHITVSNYGYYLFNKWPLFCGNTDPDSSASFRFFSDEVNIPSVQRVMIEEVKARRCRLANLQPNFSSTCYFSAIPFVGNSLGILWYRNAQVSATLVKPTVATEAK